jgi:hypothetical protein
MALINGADLSKQLEAMELAVRETIAVQAITAAQVPVQAKMQMYVPDTPGSRKKQSAKTRRKWAGAKKLKTTLRSVVRRRKRAGISAGVLGLVGPSYSDGGGHGNLFSKDHKRDVRWGRDSGTVRVVNKFVKRAADESQDHARAILTAVVKSGIEQAATRSTNG